MSPLRVLLLSYGKRQTKRIDFNILYDKIYCIICFLFINLFLLKNYIIFIIIYIRQQNKQKIITDLDHYPLFIFFHFHYFLFRFLFHDYIVGLGPISRPTYKSWLPYGPSSGKKISNPHRRKVKVFSDGKWQH